MSDNKKKIAIVGMACRFPGDANSPESYWDVLKNGKDVVTEVSSDRWDKAFYQHPDKKTPGKSYTFSAGVLSDVSKFDAAFFGISPREAAQMDPQQRLLLEVTWEALENAGTTPEDIAGSECAVVVGIASTDYIHRRVDDLSSIDPYSMTGNTASIASNRISYILNLKGPSFSVDTACSSSLVAINQACNAIWNGDAPMAIAAGVNMLLHPFSFVGFSKASMLSPRGRCRAFDESGDGYVRSEGCAALYLKPLDQAEADGDNIHAVILGTGINCDGKTNGISLPSTEGQATLLQRVYSQAGVNPNDLDYLEAHGTGTAVGDPLEAAAIAKALASKRSKPLPIGSAKTNVGHLETASGMAGIFKVILSLKNQAIPPSLHFETPNKNIDFEGYQIQVNDKLKSLKDSTKLLTMGVNSFGFGGANAHIILEEYQTTKTEKLDLPKAPPLFLSARSNKGLKAVANQYQELLQQKNTSYSALYSTIANTAYYYRQPLKHGLCVHGDTAETIIEQLKAFANDETATKAVSQKLLSPKPKLALVFSGNGSQWQGMGCELLKTEPVFKKTVEGIAELLKQYDGFSLMDAFNAPVDESQLEQTEIAQPLLFALQVGLLRVLREHGIQPEAVVGHSVGEVAAAWACGALDIEQAVQVIYERSHAQGETKGSGRMAAVAIGVNAFDALLLDAELGIDIEIAGINSPNSITISGSLHDLDILSETLRAQSIRHKILDLDYAFHSTQMEPIQQRVLDSLKSIKPSKGQLAYASTVTGEIESGETLDSTYWWDNIRQPVQFGKAIDTLLDDGYTTFIEVGPNPIMRGYINECLRAKEITGIVIPTIQANKENLDAIKAAAYSTRLAGCEFNADQLMGKKQAYTPLPTYPWQGERHWYPLTSDGYNLVSRKRAHPLLGYCLKDAEAQWENMIDIGTHPYLADHVVDGGAILPAAAYVEMALAASKSWYDKESYEIENIEIRAPVVLDHTKVLRFNLLPDDGSFKISSRDRLSNDTWTINVVGRLMGASTRNAAADLDLHEVKANCKHEITREGHYQLTEAVGLSYGSGFQGIEQVWIGDNKATAQLRIDDSITADFDQYILHPSLLDAGFQVLVDVFSNNIHDGKQAALIPVQVGKLYHYQATDTLEYLQLTIKKQSPQSVVADFILYNKQGECLVELRDCRFRAMQFARGQQAEPSSYTFQPQIMPLYDKPETSPIPPIKDLAKAVLKHLSTQDDAQQREHHYQEILPLLDAASSMFAWQALNAFATCATPFSLDSLLEQENIALDYLPLLKRMLAILQQDELASHSESDLWTLNHSPDLPPAEDIWLSILGDSSEYISELIMLGRCGTHLGEILQGKYKVNDALFPAKSSIRSHWYSASPSYKKINSALRETLRKLSTNWPANQRLRILEISGDDASLTQQLLPLLDADQTDYLFTDKQTDAISNASFELAEYPFLNTAVLDIEHPLADQVSSQDSLDFHSYDIILASNTLYQCDDLNRALGNIKRLLASEGLLLLLENQPDRFTDLTLGIDPDWWSHSDHNEQATSRLLSHNEWTQQLDDAGFESIHALQEPAATQGAGALIMMASHHATDDELAKDVPEQGQEESQQSWLILSHDKGDSAKLATALQTQLENKQQKASLLTFNSSAELQELVDTKAIIADNIIHLAGLEWSDNSSASNPASDPVVLQDIRCISTTVLAQHLDQENSECRLWLVTSNAAVIDNSIATASDTTNGTTNGTANGTANGTSAFTFTNTPSQSPLWGLGRVLMNEHPALNCFMIDLQGDKDIAVQSEKLLAEFLHADVKENEIILSEDARHVMRMRQKDITATTQASASHQHFGLDFKSPGPLKNLYWKQLPPRELKAEEIEIRPLATGLNFRDVMYAMGLLSDEAVENGFAGPTLGMELAGTVVQVGSDVIDFKAGDDVIGFAPACFSSSVITETTAVAHKPEAWSYQEAATIPTTFFTVYYALHHLAHLQEGDKILIHGAAGGVGIAAIQYARYCGAEIFATAGSDEKRDFVRLMGADHVLDSRNLNFADDIMEITDGEGIDMVLNSLAGEAINRNLAILKPFGRFLELGKRDFYENSKIGLRPFRNNISYFGIDADQLLIQRPELAGRLFREMMGLFNEGILRPLPYRTFPATRVEEAFRYMQQSRQIGKVIVSFEGQRPEVETIAIKQTALQCDPKASYLVTGGLSGFGLRTAQWLTEKGANHLILISRGGRADDEAAEQINTMREQGINIETAACDVTDEAALEKLIKSISTAQPLKGIVHAAMVLDDGLIRNMDAEQFQKAIKPKISGAWNLHTLSENLKLDLDFFVLYSSATTFMGNPGQANYVAANLFLESLASYRRANKLAATYAAWGAIDDVGFLARNEETKEALQSRLGGKPLHSKQALNMLEMLMVNNHTGAAIIDFDWSIIQRLMPSARTNKYEEQLRQCSSSADQSEDIHILIANMNPQEIQALVSKMLMDEIAQILRIPAEKLDTESSIFDLGMDSLMGMELVLAIEERFTVKLPVMALTEGANIKRIAERISDQLGNSDSDESSESAQKASRDAEKVNLIAAQHAQDFSEEDTKKLSEVISAN